MWFPETPTDDRWDDALAYLSKDKTLAKVIERVGPCTLKPRGDHYIKLVQSILSQQVSTKAAAAMYKRLASNFSRKTPRPGHVVKFLSTSDEATLRLCGLSRQKRAYILDLSTRFHDKRIRPHLFGDMSDDELVDSLTEIKGIGRWTVEMLLIFALNRPDVWPVDDLAIQENVFRLWPKKFAARPKGKEIVSFGDKWRPWRSIAAWYIWRARA